MVYHLFFADIIITILVQLKESVERHCISAFDPDIFFKVLINVWFHIFVTNMPTFVGIKFFKPLINDFFDLFSSILSCRLHNLSGRSRIHFHNHFTSLFIEFFHVIEEFLFFNRVVPTCIDFHEFVIESIFIKI